MPWGWFKKPIIDDLNDIAKIPLPAIVTLKDTWVDDAAFYSEKRKPFFSIIGGVIEGAVDLKKKLMINSFYVRLIEINGSVVVDFVRIVKTDLSYYMAIEVGVGKGEGESHKIVPVSIKKRKSDDTQIAEKEKDMNVLNDLTLYQLEILNDLYSDKDAIVNELIKKYNLSQMHPPDINDTSRIRRTDAFCRGDCRGISALRDALKAVRLCVFNGRLYICVCTISSNRTYSSNDSYDLYLYNLDGSPVSDPPLKSRYSFQHVSANPSSELGFDDYTFTELSGRDAATVNTMKFYRIPTEPVPSSSGGKKKRQTVMGRKSKSRRRFIPSSSKKYRRVLKSRTRRRVHRR